MTAIGLSAALVTPFGAGGEIDCPAMADQARRIMAGGADGLTLFGTTGEGASLGVDERTRGIETVLEAGIDPDRLIVATAATALGDTLGQAEIALGAGIRRLLVPPPFYFKPVAQPAVFSWYARLIERLDTRAEIILYHIPQMTEVPLGIALIRQLKAAFSGRIIAVKDSGGDWNQTRALIEAGIVAVLVGDERHIAPAARLGATGSINGLANVAPDRLRRVLDTGRPDADVDALVESMASLSPTPAIKALVGEMLGNADWRRVRPPLTALTTDDLEPMRRPLGALMQKEPV